MSASYPQDTAHTELRRVMKTLAKQKENKCESSVSIETGNNCWRWFEHVRERLLRLEENEIEVEEDVDEVDGRVDELLSPLVKLYFLKILLFDIGISLGDVATDVVQGINLTFDENWNIQWRTYHYGLAVFTFTWLPIIPVILHSATFRKTKQNRSSDSTSLVGTLIKYSSYLIFFPLVPTVKYMKLLLVRRRFNTNRQKLLYLKYEQETTELKAVSGSVESPLQLVLLLWLLMRGTLRLPWDEPPSSSCLEDSLGRIACLPSLPLLSLSFSFLSIVKSIFDLNLLPVFSSPIANRSKANLVGHVVLTLFPLLLCNVIFRLVSYAFIVTYIDYWAFIPGAVIYLSCLSMSGIVFIKQEGGLEEGGGEGGGVEEAGEDIHLDDLLTVNDTGEDQVSASSRGLLWNGSEWMSSSQFKGTAPGVKNESAGEDRENVDISNLINENNSPIFINSVAACFFPVVYTLFMEEAEVKRKAQNINFITRFLDWQQSILSYQTSLVNSCLIIVLLIIGILVTFVPSFNYRTNILDYFWFSTIVVFLVVLGLVGLLWSLWVYPRTIFPLTTEKVQKMITEETDVVRRRRRVTGESIVESVSSTSQIITNDGEGPPLSGLKVFFCCSLSSLVMLPGLLGLVLFSVFPHQPLYLLTGQRGQTSLNLRAAEILSTFNVPNIDFIQVKVHTNHSNERRLRLSHGNDYFDLLIDDRREELWRVSSPSNQVQDDPYIVIRNVDWDQIEFNPHHAFLCTGLERCIAGLTAMASCSSLEDSIFLESGEAGQRADRRPRKVLNSEGRIYESRRVETACFKNGLPCEEKMEMQMREVECENITFGERVRFFSSDGVEIPEYKIVLPNALEKDYCCGNSTTFLNFYGKNCNITSLIEKCIYSEDFQDGKCEFWGQLHSSVCFNGNCVIKKSFQTSCKDKSKAIGFCDVEEFYCR